MRTVIIPGDPIAQPRHQIANGRAYIPSDHAIHAYKETIRLIYGSTHKPFEGPIGAELEFYLARPKSKDKQIPPDDAWHYWDTPDADNLAKAVMDALQGLAFLDDKQICELRARKLVCGRTTEPHTKICIYSCDRWGME